MDELKLNVKGMMCTGCENRIQNVVSKIDNVQSVKADHESGIVIIKTNGKVDVDIIKNAIQDLDFIVE